MIIGIVGPVEQDIQAIIEMITESHQIQVVDSVNVIRLMDRRRINSITTQVNHKKVFLKKLEQEFGTVIVTGNLILSEDICSWILENQGVLVVVSRDKLESYDKHDLDVSEEYWCDPVVQRYELELRFKRLYESLSRSYSKDLYLIDLSNEDSEDLMSLAEVCESWNDSYQSGFNMAEIENIVDGKDDTTMTMEESIKKAMAELGVNIDETSEEPKQVEKPKKKVNKKPVQVEQTQEEPEQNDEQLDGQMSIEDYEHEVESQEPETSESIFVKISGNTMALMIPAGMKLEKQSIAGMNFEVATVPIPDLSSSKLQELYVKKTIATSKPEVPEVEKPQKVEPEKMAKKPTKTIVASGNLDDLHAEKARLDAEIKKYRAAGDMETVNALRKQRRAVRGKINSLK